MLRSSSTTRARVGRGSARSMPSACVVTSPSMSLWMATVNWNVERARLAGAATRLPSGGRLEHARRQDHGVEPRELERTLELVSRFVVEKSLVPALAFEHELAGEEDRARE